MMIQEADAIYKFGLPEVMSTAPPHTRKGHQISPETRAKISIANKGRKRSPETRKRMSDAKKNKHPSEETRAKMSKWQIGKILSEETKRKISEANRAHPGHKQTLETRERIASAHRGVPSPRPRRPQTLETKLKISNTQKGKKHPPFSEKHKANLAISASKRTGEKCPMWRGGISFEPYCPKWNNDIRNRIRHFFDHRCIVCGKSQNENITKTGKITKLHCHHVEYNKQACCDGKPVQFAALCHGHHTTTNYDRPRWEAILHRIIDEIYGGRSYYTKNEWKEVTACDST